MNLEKRRTRRKEEAEVTETGRDGHKRHVQRRWAVRLWNLHVESLIRDDCQVFINIDWGGDREEARIRTGEGHRWWQFLTDSEVVWGMGAEPLSLRSDVMRLEEKGKVAFQNEFEFEWRVGAGGNSGVEYLFTEGEKRAADFYPGDTGDSPMGFEYQVLDDTAHAGNAQNRLSASIY